MTKQVRKLRKKGNGNSDKESQKLGKELGKANHLLSETKERDTSKRKK